MNLLLETEEKNRKKHFLNKKSNLWRNRNFIIFILSHIT